MKRLILGIITLVVIVTIYYVEIHQLGYIAKYISNDEFELEKYSINNDIPNTSIYNYRVDKHFASTEDVIFCSSKD